MIANSEADSANISTNCCAGRTYTARTASGLRPRPTARRGRCLVRRSEAIRRRRLRGRKSWKGSTAGCSRHHNLSHEYNYLCGASVRLPTGQKLRVYTAHLIGDHSKSDREANRAVHARKQLAEAANIIQGNRLPYPSILTGDFNIQPPDRFTRRTEHAAAPLSLLARLYQPQLPEHDRDGLQRPLGRMGTAQRQSV